MRLRAQPFEVQHRVLQEGLRAALLLDERVHLGVGDRDALLGGRAGEQVVQQLVGDDVAGERRRGVLLALIGGHAREQRADLRLDLLQRHGRVADDDRRARLHRAAASADQRACGRDGDHSAPTLVNTLVTLSRPPERSPTPPRLACPGRRRRHRGLGRAPASWSSRVAAGMPVASDRTPGDRHRRRTWHPARHRDARAGRYRTPSTDHPAPTNADDHVPAERPRRRRRSSRRGQLNRMRPSCAEPVTVATQPVLTLIVPRRRDQLVHQSSRSVSRRAAPPIRPPSTGRGTETARAAGLYCARG